MPACLSVCLSVFLPVCLSVCIYIYALRVCLSFDSIDTPPNHPLGVPAHPCPHYCSRNTAISRMSCWVASQQTCSSYPRGGGRVMVKDEDEGGDCAYVDWMYECAIEIRVALLMFWCGVERGSDVDLRFFELDFCTIVCRS